MLLRLSLEVNAFTVDYSSSGMGKIVNMPIIDLRHYCIGFWNCDIIIDNYCITFLKMLQEFWDKVGTIWYNWIRFYTKWYYFEISRNNIIKCFSSQVAIIHYQIEDIKLIILYSKRYKTEYFQIKLVQNWDYIMKIEILCENQVEINISYIKWS